MILLLDYTSRIKGISTFSELLDSFSNISIYHAIRITFFYTHFAFLIPRYGLKEKYKIYLFTSLLSWVLFVYFMTVYYCWSYNEEISAIEWTTYVYFASGIILLQIVALLAVNAQRSFLLIKKQSDLQEENLKVQAALLRSKINPHFIFNSLNALYGLSLARSEKLSQAILNLSSIMRYVMNSSENEAISAKEELEHCTAYVEMMNLRVLTPIKLTTKNIDQCEFKIPPISILTIVENVFKHGDLNESSQALVNVSYSNNRLCIESSNLVSTKNSMNTHQGQGLDNLTKRLDLRDDLDYSNENVLDGNIHKVKFELWKV